MTSHENQEFSSFIESVRGSPDKLALLLRNANNDASKSLPDCRIGKKTRYH